MNELSRGRWPATADPQLLALLKSCAAEAARLRSGSAARLQTTLAAQDDAGLTDREGQVLELVAKGDSNKIIARQLGLSPHTVKRHLARMLAKTGHSSRGQLASWHRSVAPAGARA